MKKIKNEIVEAIEFLRNNPSMSLTKVAQQFNTDRHSLSKYSKINLDEYKYLFENEWYSLDEKELEAVEYYKSNPNITFTEIKNKFGYKNETFKTKLKVVGESQERRYLHSFNRDLFKTIETEEDAYWLGFILADGYLNEDRGFLNIKLGATDRGHLVKFCKYAQCEESLIREDVGGAENLVYSLTLNSKDIVNNLKQYGLFQAKSEKEIPYYDIDENLKSHYIRGIIDGDGWILKTLKGFGLVGSYEVCKFLVDDMKVSESYIHEHQTIKKIDIRKTDFVKQFVEKYYKDATIFLDRKMALAKQLF